MTRKLKVAPDRQLLDENGKHRYGGETFSVSDDHPEADRWIAAGYATESGKRRKSPQEATEEDARTHYVARARGLNPRPLNLNDEDEA